MRTTLVCYACVTLDSRKAQTWGLLAAAASIRGVIPCESGRSRIRSRRLETFVVADSGISSWVPPSEVAWVV